MNFGALFWWFQLVLLRSTTLIKLLENMLRLFQYITLIHSILNWTALINYATMFVFITLNLYTFFFKKSYELKYNKAYMITKF